ncbi:MAG: hypothetical protein IJY65_04995 [Clostridia bacterium]|nr:hypothetical protein [Clostridia bacterium]
MTTQKFTDSEVNEKRVASLPTRPTAPTSYGGRGFSATEMKAAFDKLPLLIIERFNSLLDDLTASGEGSLVEEILTGIKEGHTLARLFSDVTDGSFAEYLVAGNMTLKETVEYFFENTMLFPVDCGTVEERAEDEEEGR